MSLIDVPQVELIEPGQSPKHDFASDADGAPERPTSPPVFALVYYDPDVPGAGCPVGWTLTARYDTGWCWSTSLAARGAGAHATTRVAQAVAVRVLTEQGVAVEGWADPDPDPASHDQTAGRVSFRARPGRTAPSASSLGRQANPWLRRIVSRQLQGH
jgi:hypothetical protein